jgi:CRAL/TRIO domain
MILNAPGFLNGAFAAVKSILSESTRAKIAMVPSNQTTTEMLQVMLLLMQLPLLLLLLVLLFDAATASRARVVHTSAVVFG